jgi:hypothetical protein
MADHCPGCGKKYRSNVEAKKYVLTKDDGSQQKVEGAFCLGCQKDMREKGFQESTDGR